MLKSKAPGKRTLLVDFDIVLFKHAYANEFEVDWKDGTTVTLLNQSQAEYNIAQAIETLRKRCRCTDVILFVSGPFNFRYKVLPSYKHNRVDVEKPQLIEPLKEWAMQEYEVVYRQGMEADDMLGITATANKNTVLATIDKDLKQIPCKLYLWNKDILETVSIKEADKWFYRQVLTGDATDGYTGCPGIGPKKAEELLEGNLKRTWWKLIVGLYETTLEKARKIQEDQKNDKPVPKKKDWWTSYIKHCEDAGSAAAFALQTARVARICRVEDYDAVAHKPILWTPKGYNNHEGGENKN